LLLTKPYKDGGHAVHGWEITGLKTAVRVAGTLKDPRDTDTGWTVEIKWPWAGLKELVDLKRTAVPPRDGDQWRINFSRVQWDTEIAAGKYTKVKDRAEHNWVWSPQGVIDMHRPARWGYLQFSTAKPGEAKFRPDPDWAARDLLHRAYYAQRIYRKANGKYTAAVADLGLKEPGSLELQATRNTFEATVTAPAGKGAKPRRWTIGHDSRVRRSE
jgi:hypothetical protein